MIVKRPHALARFMVRCATVTGPAAALVREWYHAGETHRVEAAYLGLSGGAVQLRRRDGQQIAVPLEKPSKLDQEFIGLLNPR